METMISFFKERVKNPQFYVRLILISFLPVFTTMNMNVEDLNTWAALWEAIKDFFGNPYLLGVWAATLYQSFANTGKKVSK